MVCLVLNADTHQFIAFHLKGFAVEVLCLDEDAGGALYFLIDAGQRQTAFLSVNDFIGKGLNYRVNENSQVVFVFTDIHDHHTDEFADLGGGKPHARCGVHRLGHVGGQLF